MYEAEIDVRMKRDFKPNCGTYYKYIWCHIDDLIDINFKAKVGYGHIKLDLLVKRSFGPPERYLVANSEEAELEDGQVVWSKN